MELFQLSYISGVEIGAIERGTVALGQNLRLKATFPAQSIVGIGILKALVSHIVTELSVCCQLCMDVNLLTYDIDRL